MGEILALEFRDFDASRCEVRVRTSKTGKPRSCVLTNDAADALSAQSRHISSDLIFRRRSGDPFTASQVSKMFAALCRSLGICDARFHDLRHTYASDRAREGHDLFRIGQQLGHRSAQTTARYSHLRTDDLHTLRNGSARKPAQ